MKILILFVVYHVLSLSCINHKGHDVDWWFILKMPPVMDLNKSRKLNGYEYIYCDNTNDCADREFYLTPTLDDPFSPLMKTVDQISFTSPDTMTIVWNDQPFGKRSISDYAHSKGILSAQLNAYGFIINHSLPQFPMIDLLHGKIVLDLNTNAKYNGQHFYCVTMNTKQIDEVAKLYWNAQIIVQKSNNISTFYFKHPNIYRLQATNKTPDNTKETEDHIQVYSKAGLKLDIIVKPEREIKDFYLDIVAPKLDIDLIMETWGIGNEPLQEPMCNKPPAKTILSCTGRQEMGKYGYEFSYTLEHSKYGISLDQSKKYICVSDLNRQDKQSERGGTAICFLHNNLWDNIDRSFQRRQTCP